MNSIKTDSFVAENGKTYVLKTGKEFEILHVNDLDELCMACPAIVDGKLLIRRTAEAVYCISILSGKGAILH